MFGIGSKAHQLSFVCFIWMISHNLTEGPVTLHGLLCTGSRGMVELLLNNGAHPCVPSSCGELLTSPDETVQHALNQHRKAHWLKLVTLIRIMYNWNFLNSTSSRVTVYYTPYTITSCTNFLIFRLYTAMGGKKSPLKQFLRVWQVLYEQMHA